MPINVNNHNGETVRDPYKSIHALEKRSNKLFARFPSTDRTLIQAYIKDMQQGRNVTGRKGKRGAHHLMTLLYRLAFLSETILKRYGCSLTKVSADNLHDLFNAMETGKIKRTDGKKKAYKSTHDYIKIFKAFWRWYMRRQRKEGKGTEDITIDLSGNAEKQPEFVYMKLESLKKLMRRAKYPYDVLYLFMFDSGIRVTEMLNVKLKDITPIHGSDTLHLNIRDETSKTFGRKIKLMLCCDALLNYFKDKKFKKNDFIFPINPTVANWYLRRISQQIFGKKLEKLNEHTMNKQYATLYDFRHSSCCYWLPIYKSESALKYRFGWKKSSMIYYYSQFLGMKDTITEDDILTDTTKTQLEQQLQKEKQARELLEERMLDLEKRFQRKSVLLAKMTEKSSKQELKATFLKLLREAKREGILKK